MKNYWKTSDIKIFTDSIGYMTAKHQYAGLLIDSSFYTDRAECRRDAVKALKEMQEERNPSPFVDESWYAA